jgi:hypothetical protein
VGADGAFWTDWYEVVEGDSLRQGDLFRRLLVFVLPQDLEVLGREPAADERIPVKAGWDIADWIVMSASCDVARDSGRYPHVLLARVWPATSLNAKGKKLDEALEAIRRGYDHRRFLLSEDPRIDPPLKRSFVEFRPHFTVPLDYLKRACVAPRLRLRSPFRESFGNWVGAGFSRVGVEDDSQLPEYATGTSPRAMIDLSDSLDPSAMSGYRSEAAQAGVGRVAGLSRGVAGRLRRLLIWIRTLGRAST